MLARTLRPILRPRSLHHPPYVALSNSQVRFYSRNDRLKGSGNYKLPESADTPSWQKSNAKASQLERDNIRQVPATPHENITDTHFEPETPSDAKSAHPESESEPQEVETEPELQKPLPDLTQGIPSTLDAELRQAQARRGSSPRSLNITEDPSEPLSEGASGGREGDGRQRSEYVSSSDQKKNTAFRYMYIVLGVGFTGYAAYLGRNWDSEEETKKHADAPNGWGIGLFYNRVMARLGSTMSYYNDPVTTKLLPDEEADPNLRFPFTLVISLEDMLIHQEWTRERGWRIAKRPGVDYFLRYLSQYYELVLFTSQPSAMADQVLRKLDPYSTIRWPLYREATLYKDGGYIKDLSYLNRDLKKVIILDTDPHHVRNQPENAIVLPKWNGDPKDQTLVQMIPFLEYVATMGFEDSRRVIKSFDGTFIPAEFARREKILRQKFEAQEAEKRGKKPKVSIGGLGSLFGVKPQTMDGMQTSGEAMAEGKMLWDQIRERGQRQYMEFEKKIQEEGAKWLAEREAEEKRFQEEAMKSMKSGFFGWFGGSGDQK